MDTCLGEWLILRESPVLRSKTKVWTLWSAGGSFLGQIKWASGWRRYALFPETSARRGTQRSP